MAISRHFFDTPLFLSMFAARLVAENGLIKLVRESTLAIIIVSVSEQRFPFLNTGHVLRTC